VIRPWRVLDRSWAFDERWYRLRRDRVELPDGTVLDDYLVSVRADVAVIVAVGDDGTVPLVRQYKHGVEAITLEFPAGTVSDAEEPAGAARRELLEETGWTAPAFTPAGVFLDDATKNTSRVHVYVATGARRVAEQRLDDTEQAAGIEVVEVQLGDLRQLLDSGAIAAQSSVAAGYRVLSELGALCPAPGSESGGCERPGG
jgi:8-oxo-dGTP pyrophosphatase MutT (NUDIX family)